MKGLKGCKLTGKSGRSLGADAQVGDRVGDSAKGMCQRTLSGNAVRRWVCSLSFLCLASLYSTSPFTFTPYTYTLHSVIAQSSWKKQVKLGLIKRKELGLEERVLERLAGGGWYQRQLFVLPVNQERGGGGSGDDLVISCYGSGSVT